jgi:hypothetical protein
MHTNERRMRKAGLAPVDAVELQQMIGELAELLGTCRGLPEFMAAYRDQTEFDRWRHELAALAGSVWPCERAEASSLVLRLLDGLHYEPGVADVIDLTAQLVEAAEEVYAGLVSADRNEVAKSVRVAKLLRLRQAYADGLDAGGLSDADQDSYQLRRDDVSRRLTSHGVG